MLDSLLYLGVGPIFEQVEVGVSVRIWEEKAND